MRRVRDRSRCVHVMRSVRTVGGSVHLALGWVARHRRWALNRRRWLANKGKSTALAVGTYLSTSMAFREPFDGIGPKIINCRPVSTVTSPARRSARRCLQLPATAVAEGLDGTARCARRDVYRALDKRDGERTNTERAVIVGTAASAAAVSAAFRDSRSPAYGAFVERCFSFFLFFPSRTTKLARR